MSRGFWIQFAMTKFGPDRWFTYGTEQDNPDDFDLRADAIVRARDFLARHQRHFIRARILAGDPHDAVLHGYVNPDGSVSNPRTYERISV